MRKILTIGDPILAAKAEPVNNFGLNVQSLISEMVEILNREDSGIGLAAPQIGIGKRVILVTLTGNQEGEVLPLINPEITFFSKQKSVEYEGCLSIPNKVGLIERSEKIRVSAQNRKGEKIKLKAAGLLAREIQHEVDHLDGILFVDRTSKDRVFDFEIVDGKWVIKKEREEELIRSQL